MEALEPRQLLAGVPLLSAPQPIQVQQAQLSVDLNVFSNAAPCVADWNGDTRKDLLVGNSDFGDVEAFLNSASDAAPVFTGSTALNAGGQPIYAYYGAPQVVDWNNDSRRDLVVGDYSGRVAVYLNSPTGLIAGVNVKVGQLDFMPLAGYSKPDVVDWNNDGKKDLVVGDGSGYVHLLLNTGTDATPAFTTDQYLLAGNSETYLSVAVQGGYASPVVADWNADGKKDLLVGAADGRVYYFENTGTDQAPEFLGSAVALSAGGTVLDVGSNARPEVSDWDKDGDLDLVIGESLGGVYLVLGQPAPVLTVANATLIEGDDVTSTMVFTATLSKAVNVPVSVHYVTVDGTATLADGDFLRAEGRLLIPAGQRSGTIEVLIVGDDRIEADESFSIELSDPMGPSIANAVLTGTILNDDQPKVTIEDVVLDEGNGGTTSFDFVVTLSEATDVPVTIQYMTMDGTATEADGDFTAVPDGTLTIPAGETTGTISIQVAGDLRVEADETFTLVLLGATNAEIDLDPFTLQPVYGTAVLTNDDELSLLLSDVSQVEGNSGTSNFVFTVSLSEPTTADVTVQYATADGAAKAGQDYQAATGTLTIPAGQTSATFAVMVNGDTSVEQDETFRVVLSNASVAIVDAEGTGTIVNDDVAAAAPQVRVVLTWPRSMKGGVLNGQSKAVSFGSAWVGQKKLGRVFTITNIGKADLEITNVRVPRGFELTWGPKTTLVPREQTTIGVRVPTTKAWNFSGNITFQTNDPDAATFSFPVTATVSKKTAAQKKSAAKAVAAAPKADSAFSTSARPIRIADWLSHRKDLL